MGERDVEDFGENVEVIGVEKEEIEEIWLSFILKECGAEVVYWNLGFFFDLEEDFGLIRSCFEVAVRYLGRGYW